ncbi:hypothetical protein BIV60_18905 [Bacillus sp. MUM 116]|uniref:hypothetical protein n=1 Tax=Bacillus sp. MUM 116 TaxID=1678002 RepID=UPI0008F576E3|nr:hypothetical protein [Bacillus sp. MUM 116]OIK11024.1 hypothetical protein BIV60_18905 [Bacillus sp. MUM 116]
MKTFLNKIFERRIKVFVIIQIIFLIPIIIISIFTFTSKSVNFFYNGMLQIILAGFWFLMGIENILLKKRGFSIVSFVLAVMFVLIAIQSFNLLMK